ncbi:ultraviolet-B receptor UVR8 isoform X1 [Castanea sativa]|uniref:ultraviolet-B receptor UVR8 isoform X1 n=1 Tax=Castanea sativa TaxID=21020 RepID=UPI003F651DD2
MWSKSCNWQIIRRLDLKTCGTRIFQRWMSSENSSRSNKFAALWGNGDYGRLGHGGLESQWRPAICSAFRDQSLRAISCGGAHTLFLTESGRVFATGLNDFGQLGISENKSYSLGPVEVSGLQKEIALISAGYYHSCAITVDGELYMWGKNSNGQLGLGKRSAEVVPLPTKVDCLDGITIKMVALGSEHSMAVTDSGEALSWGIGDSGRLGHDHDHDSGILGFFKSTSEYTPRLIKNLEGIKVKNAAAGLQHSACIDENGSVFVFGESAVDKEVFGKVNNTTAQFMISELPYSEEVACGGYHTCVLTRSGELYTWGSNENGCLGIGSTDVFDLPERVQGPFLKSPVTKVSCGWKHTAAISEGNIFTWGWGGSHGTFSEDGHSSGGQLGHGSDVDYIKPTMITFEGNAKALQISCGFNHTGAILEYT